MTFISVILPLKLDWEPCYSVPDGEDVQIGDRVKVTFSHRIYTGVVCGIGLVPDIDASRISPVMSVEKDMGRIGEKEITFWKTVADYYMCTTGEVYKAAYPYGRQHLEEAKAAALQRQAEREETRRLKEVQRTEARIGRLVRRLERTGKKALSPEDAELTQTEITNLRLHLEAIRSGLPVRTCVSERSTAPETLRAEAIPELSPAQAQAYRQIHEAFVDDRPVLLHGVTGSGKTEIYIRLAREAMDRGKDVLYLVPEIALSRQLEDRLRICFGEGLHVFHSGETAVSRRETAAMLRSDAGGSMVLGTRSALFLPFANLGLVIVDEEHDSSYKQDSPAPRYNGRDSALMLARLHGCSIVLGSATPSFEELYNCSTGKHALVGLAERYYGSGDSDIEIIDTVAERRKRGMVGNFSRKLIDSINLALSDGGQVMIMRSRRAWAPAMQCTGCGEIQKCPHCNVSLSLHKGDRGDIMVCHCCGYSAPYTGRCCRCSETLISLGAGTQKIEEEAAMLFPHARTARLDSDVTRNRASESSVIRRFANGEIDILIGTRMVTKGFDFSNLTLVAVIAADALLGIQDFRADEKALQMLGQLRGRCGRRGRKGRFIIQTSQPEHPVYQSLLSNDTASMNATLMEERRAFMFPPYVRIIEIEVRDIFEDRAVRMSEALREILTRVLTPVCSPVIIGPYAPEVEKIADNHIRRIRVTMKKDRRLAPGKEAVRKAIASFEKERRYDGHITVNVDPA